MKKIAVSVLVAAALALAVTGCGTGQNTKSPVPEDASVIQQRDDLQTPQDPDPKQEESQTEADLNQPHGRRCRKRRGFRQKMQKQLP